MLWFVKVLCEISFCSQSVLFLQLIQPYFHFLKSIKNGTTYNCRTRFYFPIWWYLKWVVFGYVPHQQIVPCNRSPLSFPYLSLEVLWNALETLFLQHPMTFTIWFIVFHSFHNFTIISLSDEEYVLSCSLCFA